MSRLFQQYASKLRITLVVFVALQLASCGPPEVRAQRYYESGMKLLSSHEPYKAAVEFRNALRLKKDFLPAWRGLAQVEEITNQPKSLVPVLRTILDLDPKDELTRLELARLLLGGGAVDQSLKLVSESTEPDTNNAPLLALKAVIFYKLKDIDTAIRDAQAALKIEPGNVDALIVLAADRFANNDPNAALKLLSSSQFQETDLGTQLFKLKIYDQTKNYPQLDSLLQSLIARYPQNLAFGQELVRLYVTLHRPDDAEKELRTIVTADPKNSQSGLALIQFLYNAKGPAAARQELVSRINAGSDVFPYQLALAELDYDQGKVDDSFKSLEALGNSSDAAQAVQAKIMLAELNLRQKNTDAADKIVNDILSNGQRNADAFKIRASIRLDRNQVDAAITDLREALNDQPRSPELMLMLATAYERNGSIDLADKELADALKSSNFNPNVGLDYVAFLQRRGGADRAYDVLTELANRWPRNVQVLSALAQIKLSRQDWAGAQQISEAIKQIGNSGAISDQILGAALSGEHKYDESITAFQNAVAAAPAATQPMAQLVGAMVNDKQTDKAIAFLQSVLKENPSNAQAYVLLGNVELTNNTPDQAEKHFKAAIESQPKAEIGYLALANLYLHQNKADAELDVIQTGLKLLPDSTNLHFILASILEQKGNYDDAIAEYQYLLNRQPGSLIIINNLASLLADHRTDKASLDRAQSLAASLRDSQVAQFKDTLGWIYNRQGDFKASLPLLEEAAAGLPNSALVQYHLAMSYIGAGQSAKASDQLKQALGKTSDNDLQTKIKAGLNNISAQ
jgi:tetratricopeptide (TPR) repeat protein